MKKALWIIICVTILASVCVMAMACTNQSTATKSDDFSFATIYEAAKNAGFTGTQKELRELFKGDNAYQLAVAAGYSGTAREWLDSLVGATGEDGATPTIGENKHWFIGDIDTGVVAEGQDGATGADGVSIESIEKTDSEGLVDTYTITFSNGETSTFTVTNGKDGENGKNGQPGLNGTDGADGADGKNGQPGQNGATGATGNGIEKVEFLSSSKGKDTYRITFTDKTTFDFTVTNGKDGANGESGVSVSSIDITDGLLTITYSDESSQEFRIAAEHPHPFVEKEVLYQEPTCSEAGIRLVLCATCGEIKDMYYVPAIGHDTIHHDAKAPTCTEIGWDAYDTCSRCAYTTFEAIPATGEHDFDGEGICTVCGMNSAQELTYYIYTDHLTVSGYTESVTALVIPYTEDGKAITAIADAALKDQTELTSVTIPASVTIIGDSALAGCSSLTTIRYQGTQTEWAAIDKGNDWDKDTGNYTVKCSDDSITEANA